MDIATAFENQLEYDRRFINSVRENEMLRRIMEPQIVLCILYEIWKRERQKFLGFIFVGRNFERVLQSFNENPERFIKNSIYESCDIKLDEISEQPRKDYYSNFFPIVEQYKVCAISCVTELINYRKQLKDLAPEYFKNYFFGFIMNPLNAEINEKNFEVMADRLADVVWKIQGDGKFADCNGIRGKIIKLTEKFRISQKGIKEIKDEKMVSACDFFLEKDGVGEVYPARLVDKDKVFDYITITCNNAKLLEKTVFSRCVSCFFNQQLDFERDLIFNITKIFAHSNHERRDLLIKFLRDFDEENFNKRWMDSLCDVFKENDVNIFFRNLNNFERKFKFQKMCKEKLKDWNKDLFSMQEKVVKLNNLNSDFDIYNYHISNLKLKKDLLLQEYLEDRINDANLLIKFERLNALKEKIKANVEKYFSEFENKIRDLNNKVCDLKRKVCHENLHIEYLDEKISGCVSEKEGLKKELKEKTSEVQNIENECEKLKEVVNSYKGKIGEIQLQIRECSGTVANLEKKQKNILTTIEKTGKLLNQQKDNKEELKEALTTLNIDLQDTRNKLLDALNKSKDLEDEIVYFDNEIDKHEKDISANEIKIEEIRKYISDFSSKIEELDKNISSMENKKSELEKDIIKLQNDINENEGAIKDLSEKLSNKTILQANSYEI